MNGGNIRLRMTLKINVGCLSLASEINRGNNIRLRVTLKINVEVFIFRARTLNLFFIGGSVSGH